MYISKYDPALLRLPIKTLTPLSKSGIICLEQLFGMDEKELLSIGGIGKLKADQILDYLYGLPFDYMDPDLPGNPQKDAFLGVDTDLAKQLKLATMHFEDKTIRRGLDYFASGKVTLTGHENGCYTTKVRGTRIYDVSIFTDANDGNYGNNGQNKCNCPVGYGWSPYGDSCKHVIASLYHIACQQRLMRFGAEQVDKKAFRQLSYLVKTQNPPENNQPEGELEYVLIHSDGKWDVYPESIYQVFGNNIGELTVRDVYRYGEHWMALKPTASRDRVIVSLLKKIYRRQIHSFGHSYSYDSSGDDIGLPEVLSVLKGSALRLVHESGTPASAVIAHDPWRLTATISKGMDTGPVEGKDTGPVEGKDTGPKEGTNISTQERIHTDPEESTPPENPRPALQAAFRLQQNDEIIPFSACELISEEPCWVYCEGTVFEVVPGDSALPLLIRQMPEKITIPESDCAAFLQDILPGLQANGIRIRFEEGMLEDKVIAPVPRLYLSERGSRLLAALRFGYGSVETGLDNEAVQLYSTFPEGEHEGDRPGDGQPAGKSDPSGNGDGEAAGKSDPSNDSDGQPAGKNAPPGASRDIQVFAVKRDRSAETVWLEKLMDTGLVKTNMADTFIPAAEPLDWITARLSGLSMAGFEVFGEERLKRFRRPRQMTSGSFRISSGENWFDLEGELQFDDLQISLADIRDALVPGTGFVKLGDYDRGELPARWLNRFKRLFQQSESGAYGIRAPKIAAGAIEDFAEETGPFQADDDFRACVRQLRSFEQIKEVEAPAGFRGRLRSYQLAGLAWMCFLNEYHLGGILADDMGLGKTVQVLALLQYQAEKNGKPPLSLIVAPRSVLELWQSEAEKFTPDLTVCVHQGLDRARDAAGLPEASIYVTTYATLRNDLELFSGIPFDYAILDESHNIRNPGSKTFRAVAGIKAAHRLCLTGTPIQNTLMDIWPQFHFLNPGLAGSKAYFLNQWVKPIEKYQDKTAEEMVQKMVSPFILRRTKQKVAVELPKLTSSIVHCHMETAQRTVYEKLRKSYYNIINKSINEKGLRQSRFTVLEGLTRLRQVSCSPALVSPGKTESAKIKRFVELAGELISEGHRALVFSQFVQFLKLIEQEVKKKKWPYEYLDGSTNDRRERVTRFQEDESRKIFLISLKAGGEGLNLTGADYVFIMDPWWNPAAERQAMDRTHRIGQTEKVFVYRLVCPDTVEEKILRLQERKQNLAEQLIRAEAGIFKKLDKDDLLSLFS